ncbi:MFS general substrate transporter [Rhizoctonia solani]|nr:MFS general substrate transporter [Rhizoctonia solani]
MDEVPKKPDGEVKHVEDNGIIDSPFKGPDLDSDAEFGGTEERKRLEKKLVRKIDARMSIMVIIYILNSIDRNNAAAARLRGFEGDLGLKDQEFPTILSIFYVGYILMQVPSNMFLNYIGKPSLYLPVCMILWGGISCLTGITHSFVPALLTRFFLGFVEAAFFPGALFMLSKWYKREELGLRTAILYCGSLSSNAFGGLLAAGILDGMEGKLGHAAWRWLFYVEGAITIAVAILAVFILPDFPSTSSRWLSPTEQRLAELRMIEDAGGEADQDSSVGGPFYGFVLTVKDWKVWWLSVALTAQVVGLSFNSYFPTLTSTLGYSRTVSLLLCAPPWAFASIVSFICSRHADKTGERFYHIAGSYVVGIVGFIIAEVTMNVAARYLALFLMAQSYAGFIIFWAWCSNSLPRPPSKRAVALALINAFSQLGTYPDSYRNSYGICTACFGLTIVMCFMFRHHLISLNHRLDRGEEVDGIRDTREAMEDAAELQGVSVEDIQQTRRGFRFVY